MAHVPRRLAEDTAAMGQRRVVLTSESNSGKYCIEYVFGMSMEADGSHCVLIWPFFAMAHTSASGHVSASDHCVGK